MASRGASQSKMQPDSRSDAWHAVDMEPRTDGMRTFAHARQTPVPPESGAAFAGASDASAVVCDLEHQQRGSAPQRQSHLSCSGVLEGIAQRLQADVQQLVVQIVGQRVVDIGDDGDEGALVLERKLLAGLDQGPAQRDASASQLAQTGHLPAGFGQYLFGAVDRAFQRLANRVV